MTLTLGDEFCGFGGSSQGAAVVPGVSTAWAANHAERAIRVHELNFPHADHILGDVQKKKTRRQLPPCDIFWASPACPPWSNARGERRDFDASTQQDMLFDPEESPAERARRQELKKRRALMEEIPRYLRVMAWRGTPVLAGVVENVVECRLWHDFDRWRREIEDVGYRTRVIALNSMHAEPVRSRRAPQSRDRFYLAYWSVKLGRDPDFDKWLRPLAWCPTCQEAVRAVQTWKRDGVDMGKYRAQYVYRCPRTTCRRQVVEPAILPAAAAIDWTLPGERIGDKPLKEFFADKSKTQSLGFHPLAPKTLARIEAGLRKYARPVLALAGGTWRDEASPLSMPMPTRTTRETDGVLVPPLLVPVEGRPGKVAAPIDTAGRTQTARNETGLLIPPLVMRNNTPRPGRDGGGYLSVPVDRALGALTTAGHQSVIVPPFIAELRGGGSVARPVTEALATVSAQGNHHGLVLTPEQTMAAWAALYAYDSGRLVDHTRQALPTQTTVEGDALVAGDLALPDVEDCLFRMLEPHEIAAGMAFHDDYQVVGNKRERVAGYGNAVTPPVAEVLVSALVECITGQELDR